MQLRHGCFELGRDESEWLMLDAKGLIEVDRFGYQIGVKLVQVVVEKSSEIFRQIIRLL